MMVALVITSIVVGLAFTVLSLVQKQMNTIDKNLSNNQSVTLLQESLWIDFNRYENIRIESNKLNMFHPLDSVSYIFNTNYSIKQKDTFKVVVKSMTGYFNASPVMSGQINAISLEVDIEGVLKKVFAYKTNTAVNYMN